MQQVCGKTHELGTIRFLKILQNSKKEFISYSFLHTKAPPFTPALVSNLENPSDPKGKGSQSIFWYHEGKKLYLAQSICLIRGEKETQLHFPGMQIFYKSQKRVVFQNSLEVILEFINSANIEHSVYLFSFSSFSPFLNTFWSVENKNLPSTEQTFSILCQIH